MSIKYGFVIVGTDIRYDPNSKRVFVDRNNYYDRYGQQGATDEELDDYIKKYLFCTDV